MTKRPLTEAQREAMNVLNEHVGETVLVLTSGYTANVDERAIRESVTTVTSAALRGLAAREIVAVDAFWKGANVTVLRRATAEEMGEEMGET